MTGLRRRDFLTAAVVGTTAAVVPGASLTARGAESRSASDWTTYRGNARRTGATDADGPGADVGTERSMDPGGSVAEPAVADGTLYLGITTAHTPSASEGYVAAYDPATGEERWRKGGISRPGTLTVGDGAVYVATHGTEDSDGSGFFALDAGTGETRWHRPASFGLEDVVFADGRLYGEAGSDACALDAGTGEVRWRTAGVGGGTCYADGTVYYGTGVALDAADGNSRWNVSGDVGNQWSDDVVQTVGGGTTYGTLSGQDLPTEVQARSAADGSLRWSHSPGSGSYWRFDRLAVAGGRVVCTFDDTVHALDAATGETAWTYEADVQLTSSPTMASGTVYVGGRTDPESESGDAAVVALDANSGERTWRHVFGSWEFEDYGPAAATPVVVGGNVFAATYPEGSTIDHEYTEHADFHVLGSGGGDGGTTATTSEPSTTTSEGTTTGSETTTSRTATEPPATTSETATATDATRTTSKPTATTTNAKTGAAQSTTTDGLQTTTAAGSTGSGTGTTATDGQTGFGVLSALGGLAGVGAYLRSRLDAED
ncbi:hypothetical protein DMJ13_15530 [halophilic archaeon]|nr:hypothetical protein DMJ13_15530 [halophilic archaeon]